jgi:phosphoribosyl 1,2-cyclic phosphodiesterase
MKVYFGGVRGGGPMTEPTCNEFGGDTTSFLIEGDAGERIIIDAGTGLRHVQRRLASLAPHNRAVCILFSHYHLDHLAGLPSFQPLYEEGWNIEMAARIFDELTVEDIAASFVNPPIWPLHIDELKATKRFRILDDESMEATTAYGGLAIRWCPLHHPGGSTAFRIEEPASGASVVIATDVEWAESTAEEHRWLNELCATPHGADLLVFDGKYTADEYPAYRGWGHSTWQEGIELARSTGVKQLLITHHDITLDDAAARTREQEIQAAWPQAALARQGMIWTPAG